jgi:hypothetical protein
LKIASVQAPPPPREISMTFSSGEGWAVVAALREYADHHAGAADVAKWNEWATALDRELHRE